jgi:hypothetical protein
MAQVDVSLLASIRDEDYVRLQAAISERRAGVSAASRENFDLARRMADALGKKLQERYDSAKVVGDALGSFRETLDKDRDKWAARVGEM